MPPRMRRSAALQPSSAKMACTLPPANDQSLKGRKRRILSLWPDESVWAFPPVDWGGDERHAGAAAAPLFFSYGLIRQFRASPVTSMGEFKALPTMYLVNRYHAGAFGWVHAAELTEETLPWVVEPPGEASDAPGAGAVALERVDAAGRH